MTVSLLAGVSALALPSNAQAQTPAVLNVCAGPSVTLPVLTPVANVVDTSVIAGLVNPLLSGLVGNINTNLTGALSGQQLSVSLIDQNGNLVSVPSGGCSITTNSANGITVGGGRIDGLGGNGNPVASAGDPSAIAIGNGATTAPGIANALALGTGSNATVAGGVALGSGSLADRVNPATEPFSGAALPAQGVVSVGAPGNERQITNVAGGTQPTDATNLRQLQSVGTALSGALGGGAGFNGTTGAFTAPGYVIGGNTYNDVGSALAAISGAAGTGLVQQATPTAPITVGAATGGGSVVFSGTAGNRVLTGIAPGAVAPGSTDAITGAQLYPVQTGLTNAVSVFGSGASFNPATGAVTNPTYVVGNTPYTDVGSAIAALQTGANPIGPGLVVQNNPTAPITVGAATGGLVVNVSGTAGPRVITGVAGGSVAPGSTDAVNGGQLAATNAGVAGVASSLGGGANFNAATGAYTGPTYQVGGTTYTTVGGAVQALDTAGVKYDIDPATGARSNSVTLAGGDPNTPVLVRNVAPGTLNTDAANVGQVRAAQQASMAYTDQRSAQTLQQARDYTDGRLADQSAAFNQGFAQLNRDIAEVRREARQAAAVGLAAASLRYDDRPGKLSLAAGGGGWRGQGAAAFGVGYTSPDGFARFNVGLATTGDQWGVGGGVSLTLN